ncbi:MAG: ATP-binding protein [Oscillospiraceae bacterium]|nr:ATP-binding protein [Oscillospiraceae bacterium]
MLKMIAFLRSEKQLLAQYLLVVVSFVIMIVISGSFASWIVSGNVSSYGEEVVNASAETVTAFLASYKDTLDDVAFDLGRTYALSKGSYDELESSLDAWTDWLQTKHKYDREDSFLFFYVFTEEGKLARASSSWVPQPGYDPMARPWYIGAAEKAGDTFYTNPYIDERTGKLVTTLSKIVYHEGSDEPLGVIGLDVRIADISRHVGQMHFMNSGYGVLFDPELVFIAHPDNSYIGQKLTDIGDQYEALAKQLLLEGTFSAFPFRSSYSEEESVAFFRTLFNGWHIGIISTNSVYYRDVQTMQLLLALVGLALMVLQCIVLTFLHRAKNRSEKASQVKSSFLASMSHEIRTPMNAVIGMSDLLLKEPLNGRQMGYAKDISASAHSLLGIINDVLDMSKIESGRMTLNPVDYDFGAFTDNLNSMFGFMARNKGLEFKLEREGALPEYLFGDDIRLRQVLTNICGNAVKFTEKGSVTLKVSAAKGQLTFIVKDTGRGIPKEALPALFDAFSQFDKDNNRNIVGTGLGLSISKNFIEMMGGTITVESEYGRGTAFAVTIPVVEGSKAGVQFKGGMARERTLCAPEARALIVDDNDFNLRVAQGLLRLFQIEPELAESGPKAIQMIQQEDFDIVFMDHMMPEMDGIEATAEIRKLGGKYSELPIVALTANAVQGAKELFLASGFNGFVSKPINVGELVAMLERWLPEQKVRWVEKTENHEPAEKKTLPEQPAINATGSAFLDAVGQSGEIKPEIGLSRVSGMEGLYRETLELFQHKLIPEGQKMSGFLEEGDIGNFAISVHAMKSSLATVGAMRLSEVALKLEMAAKSRDTETCTGTFPELIEGITALHQHLTTVFAEEKTAVQKEKGDPALLIEKVHKTLEGIGNFDEDTAGEILQNLMKFDFGEESNATLEKAHQMLKTSFDYDGAAAVLKTITEETEQ